MTLTSRRSAAPKPRTGTRMVGFGGGLTPTPTPIVDSGPGRRHPLHKLGGARYHNSFPSAFCMVILMRTKVARLLAAIFCITRAR
jgi:hypothetical protein